MARAGRLVGQKVDRYRFQQLIGRGSSSEVYRAHDMRLHRDVAIKVFDPDARRKAEILERFMKEARIQARLEHANIVPIYDLLEHRKQMFLVMRFVHGQNLRKIIERRGTALDPLEALAYMRQVLDGVAFAHSKGVIHQDLKPHNIQVTPAGEALVLDFGVARLVDDSKPARTKLTGTPAYMSPEQVEGKFTDARTDIYSLGMSLYQVVTGHHPFEDADDLQQILRWQVEKPPTPPSHYNPQLPGRLEDAIMRAIAKAPRDRYRSCHGFCEALENALDQRMTDSIHALDVRWDPRADVVVPARVKVDGEEEYRPARTSDLSVGGVALNMADPPSLGTRCTVEIYLPVAGSARVVRTRAKVVWVGGERGRDQTGLGLRFIKLSDGDRVRIGAVVREQLVLGDEPGFLGGETQQGERTPINLAREPEK